MAGQRILGIVLAGGAGKRLAPLTADRAKPAVPFGGLYRLVDFALSNLVNAGCRRICVLTQYKSHSLDRQAVVKNAILDKNVVVPEGATVGVDKEHDRARGFVVSSGGITVVGKGQVVAP
jgi:ADP-glucose pyrophosphorylase